MCIGTPMQILEASPWRATALATDGVRCLSLTLTGPLEPGSWVLAQGDLAIRQITPDDADLIEAALDACLRAENGQDWEAGFADLINREPELPAHLRGPSDTIINGREPRHGGSGP
jgi:hydrogenase expression/formation protein HypC